MHGSFSEEALEQFAQLAAQTQAADFTEGDLYDFTRCVRPDGSAYGTRGKCRKGSEAAAVEKPVKASRTPKPKGGLGTRPETPVEKARDRAEVNKLGRTVDQLSPSERAAREARKKAGGVDMPRPKTSSADAKKVWGDAEGAVVSAKANLRAIQKETKGNQSVEANVRRRNAEALLEKAEKASVAAYDRFMSARAKENRANMTPEQRKLEREANKLTKGG